MRDFIPEGEDSGSPTGVGGYRDFVPQEEIDAKRAKNEAVLEESAPKSKKGSKKASKKASKAKVSKPKAEPKTEEKPTNIE